MKVKLTEICTPKQWKTIPTNALLEDGYPVYGANGIIGYYDEYNHEEPVIAITCRGATCGTINLTVPKAYITGNAMCLDNVCADVLPDYLYYCLLHYNFNNIISGSAQPQITRQGLAKVEIELHPIIEQGKIINSLRKSKAIINARQNQLQKLDDLVKARFVELFGDESNPYNFPIVNIEDVASVRVGVVIKPAQYYTDAGHGIKTFRSLNIGPMHIKDTDWVYFSEEGNRKNQKSVLNESDLVIVRSGAPGTACVITKEYVGCNAVDIIIARPDLDKVNPYYLCQYTNLPHGKKQIEEGTGGAAQQHFNVGKYNKIRLTLPPLDQQLKFEKFVEQTDKSKVAVQKSLDEAQLLFDSLMQQYFG